MTLTRPKLLYADSDQDSRDLVKMICRLADIDVTVASSVDDAIDLAISADFDLFLLETRFPDGSGLDFCRRLRDKAARVPVVFLSASASRADIEAGFHAGADAYLTKPFVGDLGKLLLEKVGRGQRSPST